MRHINKSTKTRFAISALLASTALGLAMPAMAQEAAAEDDDVIVVTAQKREQNLQDVPLAITAIGTEKLDQLQVNDLQDVVKFLPSVTIQSGGPGFAQVYFRGVASGENANHSTSLPTVGTYLDEMPTTTIQGSLDIHAYDLARVEALAGPQGTLYGASSMAGTIRLITNAPDPSGTYGEVGLELNSVAHGELGGVGEGFINARLGDNAALRLVGWYRKDGGYIDNIAGSRTYASSNITQNNAALVEDDYNDVETYGARIALGIDLNDSWTIKPVVMGQIQKSDGNFSQERSSAVNDKLQVVQYNPERGDDKWIQAGLTIEGKIGTWDLTATGGHMRRKTETESDYSDYSYFYDAISSYGDFFYDNNDVLVNPNQYIQGIDRYKRTFGEVRISSPQDSRLRLIAGLFYQRQSHNIEQNYIIDNIADRITVAGTASNIWLTKQLRVDRDYAAFGEISFDLSDKLTLTGGLRVYKYDNSLQGFFGYAAGFANTGERQCLNTDGTTRRQNPAGTPVPILVPGSPCTNVGKSTSDTDFIHKLNATYKFSDDALIYATWSRGFRPGGINRRGTLPPYGADELDNYELGWKTTFGAFRWNGAVYQEDWNNIQLSFLGANGLSEVRNAGIGRIRGVEMDVGYRAGGFTLNAGFSYNDAEIRRDFCRIANPQFDCTTPVGNSRLAPAGTRLPTTAKFKGNAVARYEFPVGSWEGHVQGAVNYIGSRINDLRPTTNAILGNLDAYTTADFSVGVKNDMWSGEIFVTNLFDSNGVNSSGVSCSESICGDAGGDTATGGVFYDSVIKPRLIGVKVSRKF